MTPPHQQTWHIKKQIDLAHITTTLVLIVGGVLFVSEMDKRIDRNTQNLEHVKQLRSEDLKRIDKRLDTIEGLIREMMNNPQGVNN